MNILFLSAFSILNIQDRNIYCDLFRHFRSEGHTIFIATPVERREKIKTQLYVSEGVHILRIKTPNLQKTSKVEKGLGQLLLPYLFENKIKKYYGNIRFDIILYSTPPITFTRLIQKLKRRNLAKSYLLLKDIFPQNAVDLGFFSKKSLFYWYFRRQEKKLYQVSDFIGCMSPANVEYVLKHNHLNGKLVEVCPNSIEPSNEIIPEEEKNAIRKKYKLPEDSLIFIYGGNLGKPQGLDFLLEVIKESKELKNVFYIIVGSGTEYSLINDWFTQNQPKNAILIKGLPKKDFDLLLQASDIGMIFLDIRFSIPNFPSRLLSYMEFSKPVIAATDCNTDIGKIIEENGFGYWCESGDIKKFMCNVSLLASDRNNMLLMGERANNYLHENFLVRHSYQAIIKHFECV